MITGFVNDPLLRPIGDNREYGTHTPDGIFVLAGPNIQANQNIGLTYITDVTPTLLASINVPLPGNIDGRVCQLAFDSLPTVQYQDVTDDIIGRTTLAHDDADEVLRRLEDLGYL